ncbi:hypothetical protein [Roseivirga pacifica]|uniref:hypothetical protein n=1 Tax=Roseivirga pacifica TaxID=1267423 RepID=UPI003BABC3F1
MEDCLKEGVHKLWKFVHLEDYEYQSPRVKGVEFNSKWLEINDGVITVKGSKGGFAWDGCTPKKNWKHLTIGTPDGMLHTFGNNDHKPITYYASMIHDAIYQYKACVPLSRKVTDLIFLDMLKERKFYWTKVYYRTVRALGGIYGDWMIKD